MVWLYLAAGKSYRHSDGIFGKLTQRTFLKTKTIERKAKSTISILFLLGVCHLVWGALKMYHFSFTNLILFLYELTSGLVCLVTSSNFKFNLEWKVQSWNLSHILYFKSFSHCTLLFNLQRQTTFRVPYPIRNSTVNWFVLNEVRHF